MTDDQATGGYVNMFDLPPAQRKAREAENAREVMRELRGRTFYTRTDHGRGDTDYVRVYVAERRDKISDITYYVARACDLTIRDRGIPFGGGGYSKGLEAAECASRAAGERKFDQHRWQELS